MRFFTHRDSSQWKNITTIKSSFSRLHHQAILHFFLYCNHMRARCRCRSYVKKRKRKNTHTKWINKLSESFVLRFARNFLTVCCVLQRKVFQINFHSYRMKHAWTAVVIFMDLTIEKRHKKNENCTPTTMMLMVVVGNLCNLCYKLIVNCQHDMLDIQTDNT